MENAHFSIRIFIVKRAQNFCLHTLIYKFKVSDRDDSIKYNIIKSENILSPINIIKNEFL